MMDNVFRWNVHSVLRNMHEAQVISLFFPYLGRALIVDLRCDEAEGPLIRTDSLVAGPQERLERLRKLRPRFEMPSNVMLAPWLGPVRSLDTSGALADLSARLERIGHPEVTMELDRAYDALLELERGEVLALIRGDVQRTRTLFQR
jgi:hypothetical protein